MLGVSQPTYSQEELDRIHKETTETIEYNGKEKTLYEWKQTQRRLEREYRKAQTQSDMFKASGNNVVAREYKNRADTIRDTYDDLTSKVPGLYDHSERMRTYFKQTKELTSGGNGGIIKHEKTQNKGRYNWSQEKIDEITENDLKNINFTFKPSYNPRIRANGITRIAEDKNRNVLYIEKIEIGKQDTHSVEFLTDTIIHEELEARLAMKSRFSEKCKDLYYGDDVVRHNYINQVIKKYFKLKGWWYDDGK